MKLDIMARCNNKRLLRTVLVNRLIGRVRGHRFISSNSESNSTNIVIFSKF